MYYKGFCLSEVVRRLNVSEKAVRALIASGELPAVRIGRTIRVSLLAVRHFETRSADEPR